MVSVSRTYLGEAVLELLPEHAHVLAVEFIDSCQYDLPVPHLGNQGLHVSYILTNAELKHSCAALFTQGYTNTMGAQCSLRTW
jgi:hypothetical protein